MEKVIIASNNMNKIREFSEMLGKDVQVLSLHDVGFDSEIDENGETFFDNALIKAKTISLFLREKGISGYLISIGGNVCTVGSKPDGEMWTVGIENPDGGFFEKVCVSDMSVVTSGSYQRYFELDGVRYHHIIDPDTLMPKNDYVSVTVISEDSALADTLSTALFNMDLGQGKTLLLSLENAYAMWVTAEGEKIYSDGFERFIVKNGL